MENNINIQYQYKYQIDYYLYGLSKNKYNIAVVGLPKYLEISSRTFRRWRRYKLGDKETISVDKMYLLASFFGVSIESMIVGFPVGAFVPELQEIKKNFVSKEEYQKLIDSYISDMKGDPSWNDYIINSTNPLENLEDHYINNALFLLQKNDNIFCKDFKIM